ncbi:MAG: GNAT family N-acetyltransferase [Chloroflexota bacterium]
MSNAVGCASVRVRNMRLADKTVLMDILHQTAEFTPAEVLVAQELVDAYLNDPVRSGYNVLVAGLDDAVVGYVCYGPTPLTKTTWDMYWIAVAPAEKRRGIGRSLFAAAEDRIRDAGGRLTLIETSSKPEYRQTRKFHRSQGYKLVNRIRNFYAPGDDRLTFQKLLG